MISKCLALLIDMEIKNSIRREFEERRGDFSRQEIDICDWFTRMYPDEFNYLLTYFGNEPRISGSKKRRVEFIDAFCVAVMRINSPARLFELVPFTPPSMGCTEHTLLSHVLCRFFEKFKYSKIEVFRRVFGHFLKRRMDEYLLAFIDAGSPFALDSYFGAVAGLVDGTTIQICRPSEFVENDDGTFSRDQYGPLQRRMYSGYKKEHCIQFMGYLFPDGLFFLLDVNEGSVNDFEAMRRSCVPDILLEAQERTGRKFNFYADSGVYCSRPGYEHLIRRPLFATMDPSYEGHRNVNRRMSSIRIANEWAFGMLFNYFRGFHDDTRCQVGNGFVGDFLFASLYLNLITCMRGGNETSDYFQLNPPDFHTFMAVLMNDIFV